MLSFASEKFKETDTSNNLIGQGRAFGMGRDITCYKINTDENYIESDYMCLNCKGDIVFGNYYI